jgi:lambda repressor-like predicted transcriptional regulator
MALPKNINIKYKKKKKPIPALIKQKGFHLQSKEKIASSSNHTLSSVLHHLH